MAPPPPLRGHALLVMPDGPGREHVADLLGALGLEVPVASEPYEAMAAFVQRPSALVVLSLRAFRRRDVSFVRTLLTRRPETRVLLLVPPGRRTLAARVLAAGAHAFVPDPCYADELHAVARALLAPARAAPAPDRSEQPRPADGTTAAVGLARLASEVAHAIGNPLQILELTRADGPRAASDMQRSIARIKAVVGMLNDYAGSAGRVERGQVDLARLARETLGRSDADLPLRVEGALPRDEAWIEADADQVRLALRSLVGFVAGASGRPDPTVRLLLRQGAEAAGQVAMDLQVADLDPRRAEIAASRPSVIETHDETRTSYPGLALPGAVAARHGGALRVAPLAGGGTCVTLAFRGNGAAPDRQGDPARG